MSDGRHIITHHQQDMNHKALPMNPKLTVAMTKAIEMVKRGVPVAKAARQADVWPQSLYLALKREGINTPGAKLTGAAAIKKAVTQ